MARKLLPVDEILGVLSSSAQRIRELTKGASAVELRTPPEAGEWSANEVLAHLRSCGDMWGAAIERILGEDHPTIRAVNPTTWIEQTNYRELEFDRSFRAFVKQRRALLTVLEALTPADWSRAATITGAGRPSERTVHFYAQWMATHERPHLRQIAKAVDAVRGRG